MSLLAETIRLAGQPAVLTHSGEAQNCHIYYDTGGAILGGKRVQTDIEFSNEGTFVIPIQTGLALSVGDLVNANSEYFLVASVLPIYLFSELQGYRGRMLKCNSLVDVLHWNSTNRIWIVFKSQVRCLITQTRERGWEQDLTVVERRYSGRDEPFLLYISASSGVDKNSRILDEDGNRFRLGTDQNPFVQEGLLIANIQWER